MEERGRRTKGGGEREKPRATRGKKTAPPAAQPAPPFLLSPSNHHHRPLFYLVFRGGCGRKPELEAGRLSLQARAKGELLNDPEAHFPSLDLADSPPSSHSVSIAASVSRLSRKTSSQWCFLSPFEKVRPFPPSGTQEDEGVSELMQPRASSSLFLPSLTSLPLFTPFRRPSRPSYLHPLLPTSIHPLLPPKHFLPLW